MALVQTIERALRERFGSDETIITLADVLSVLKSHQNSCCAAGNQNKSQQQRAAQQNASPTPVSRDRTQQNASQELPNSVATKTQGLRSRQSSAKPSGKSSQGTQSPIKPTQIAIPLSQGTQSPSNKEKTPPTEEQALKQKPSYADIAKKAPEKAPQQPKKPRKASTLPESVKLAPKTPKPIKISLREHIRKTPKELIALIQERAVNGERLTGLIKAFRLLSPKSLLVYPTTEAAREELS